jgi:CheY-like chemotaxis protein
VTDLTINGNPVRIEFDPQTPIIIYSGAALESNVEEALRAGANVFVSKPHIGKLLETVKVMLFE